MLDAYRKVSSHIAGSSQPLGTKTTVYSQVQFGPFVFCLISACTLFLRWGIKSFPRPGNAGGCLTFQMETTAHDGESENFRQVSPKGAEMRSGGIACNAEHGLESAREQEREKAAGFMPESTDWLDV